MEVGLLHAEISQKLCNAWMSTIIHTICERGRMSGAHSINKGFSFLSGIPDLWHHTLTARATDLIVNLNSLNGDHGRSTRARFLALGKSFQLRDAILFVR